MVNLLPSHLLEMTVLSWDPELISWDTETSGLYADDGARVSTVSIAWSGEPHGQWESYANVTAGWEEIAPGWREWIVSVAWPFDQGTEGKPEDKGQFGLWAEADNLDVREWLDLLVLLGQCDLNAHNAKFDLEKMRVGVRRWPGIGRDLQDNVVWDTQIGNATLWPLEKTSLKPTCARIFGQQWADEAAVVKRYLQKSKLPVGRWDLIPWDVIGQYADTDARITHMLRLRQLWEIEQGTAAAWLRNGHFASPLDAIQRRLETMKVLYRMEMRGLPYDEVGSRDAAIEARNRAKELEPQLPFRPTGEAAKKYFFTDEGLDLVPYGVTDKGAPSLTSEILGRMVADEVPHAKDWAEWNKVSNAASMWYEGYADAVGLDGRLRTCFRQNGTRSSRFSVERVNLQAIPQDYRLSDHSILAGIPTPRQLIARAVSDMGWRLFELDLKQAELRIATMFAGCQLMYDMIVKGEDLHTFTTKALFPQVDPEDPLFHAKWRQVGKRGNFSLQFGSGGATFKAMVSKETGIVLTDSEANRVVRDWNALYPEFGRAIKKHMHIVEKRQQRYGAGWMGYLNGERRWFQEYEEAHKAFNQRVQGNLGQFGIDWMLQSDEFLRSKGLDEYGAGLVLTIHDSQVLLLPPGPEGEMLAAKCAQFGEDLWRDTFPDMPGGVDYHSWEYQ